MRTLSLDDARAFYNRFGAKQDEQAYYEDAALDALLQHAGFEHACVVYEFGCGTGRFAERALEDLLPGSSWYRGMDISETMVSIAQNRLGRFGDRAQVWKSDGAMRIDAPDGSVDCVVSTYVLDLLPETAIVEFLDEAARVLTDDGRLCVAGLTSGTTLRSRATMFLWRMAHWIRPVWVGGCRPIRVAAMLDPAKWRVEHTGTVVARGIPSEVLVARPARS